VARTENQNLRERLRSLAILVDRRPGEPKVIPDAVAKSLARGVLSRGLPVNAMARAPFGGPLQYQIALKRCDARIARSA